MNALQLIGVTLLALGFIVLLVLWLGQRWRINALEIENNELVDRVAVLHQLVTKARTEKTEWLSERVKLAQRIADQQQRIVDLQSDKVNLLKNLHGRFVS